ncbi:MAG: murein transglycosylase, partial [Thaumarchaeota archaeon]|nr:murein transglycosylase [Nitrososphaerota archaeon]
IATDQAIIPFGTLVTIPTLPTPWNTQGFASSDVGPAITGQHIDVYTGEGKIALSEAYRITGYGNTVCVANN